MISVVIFTSNLFLPSLTRTSLSHTHCLCQAFTAPTHTPSQREPPTPTHHDPSSTQPSSDPLRSAHDSTQPSSDPLRSAHDPSSTHSTKIAPIHSDPLTIQAPIHSKHSTKIAPIHSDPLTIQAPIQSTLMVSFLFSFLTPISLFSDPPSFLRSTVFPFLADNPISPIHKSSLQFSLRPTVMLVHYYYFFLLLYINFLGI